jgi:hypothetical protein
MAAQEILRLAVSLLAVAAVGLVLLLALVAVLLWKQKL